MSVLTAAYEAGVKLAVQEAGLLTKEAIGPALLAAGLGAGVGALAGGEQNRGRGALIGGGTLLGTHLGARLGNSLVRANPLLGLASMVGGGVLGNMAGRAVSPARMEPTGWVPQQG